MLKTGQKELGSPDGRNNTSAVIILTVNRLRDFNIACSLSLSSQLKLLFTRPLSLPPRHRLFVFSRSVDTSELLTKSPPV